MSHTMTVGQAAAQLHELVATLGPDDEIVLTAGDRVVARLIGQARSGDARWPSPPSRRSGNCRGMLTVLAEDDDHLAGIGEYLR